MVREHGENTAHFSEQSLFSRATLFHAAASVILVLIVWLGLLCWPVGYLGYIADETSGEILNVALGTEASRVRLQAGDRIIEIYGEPWRSVMSRWNIQPLIPNHGEPIPMSVVREGRVQHTALLHRAPSISMQMTKAVNIGLALICVGVGYVLGIVRRQVLPVALPMAFLWLAIGAVLGSYIFAAQLSLPLHTLLQCLLLIVLLPLIVAVHVSYPVRQTNKIVLGRTRRIVIGWMTLGAVLLVGVILVRQPTAAELLEITNPLVIAGVFLSFILSTVFLVRAYHKTTISHVRRQIRLIAFAVVAVACLWAIIVSIAFLGDFPALWSNQASNAIIVLIPLAYLAGGIQIDLYRLDRTAQRLMLHLLTLSVLLLVTTEVVRLFQVTIAPDRLWTVIVIVISYQPTFLLFRRFLQIGVKDNANYLALHATLQRLTQTLDDEALIQHVLDGVSAAFDNVPAVWYRTTHNDSQMLELYPQKRIPALPKSLRLGTVVTSLVDSRRIYTTSELATQIGNLALDDSEELLLWGCSIVLWCPIVHTSGRLLGLLLLGPRANFDPYRERDRRELQRLLDAASLAFTNSATYQERCEAEATIRSLYQALQESQDATAAAISREIHDEVLNVNVRLNVAALEEMLKQIDDSVIRREIELLLESEKTIASSLRMLCESLHPTGIDDPLGLPSVLRALVQSVSPIVNGDCEFVISGEPVPIGPQTQREMLRIAREALTNAVKHAQATKVLLTLQYPDRPSTNLAMLVQDNGQARKPLVPRPGHLGIRNMLERTHTIGGELQFEHAAGGGTIVRLLLPPDSVNAQTSAQVCQINGK